jgi:hypothetical protein
MTTLLNSKWISTERFEKRHYTSALDFHMEEKDEFKVPARLRST